MRKPRNIAERILRFNQGRNPKLLPLKYQAMQADVFAFFRGSCHLFYEDLPQTSMLNDAPPVWCCGDLHLENFGSYKGENRLVYFDVNDFDEAALAPCAWDIARFSVSVLTAAQSLMQKESAALALIENYLDAYAQALIPGRARVVEVGTAEGLIKKLLLGLGSRNREAFLNKRTEIKDRQRRFILDRKRILPATEQERSEIEAMFKAWAAKQSNPQFFRLLDVAHRIAGTGSLGLERYLLLVEGNGSPRRNYLLDFKFEPGSCLQPYSPIEQPRWTNEAARVVAVQERFQGTPPALLTALMFERKAFVLRELQPLQDRVRLTPGKVGVKALTSLLRSMGEITAFDHLRGGGRQGSASADDLIAFAQKRSWRRALIAYARNYARQVEKDYQEFAAVDPTIFKDSFTAKSRFK